jgi:beta-mannanase
MLNLHKSYSIIVCSTLLAFVVIVIINIFTILDYVVDAFPESSKNTKEQLQESERVKLGVFIPDALDTKLESVFEFERLVDHKMNYLLMFNSFGDENNNYLSLENFEYLQVKELKPIITWEPWKRDFSDPGRFQPAFSLEAISKGELDNYIKRWANDIKDIKIDVILRFGHEMNTPEGQKIWYPWQGEPQNYINAYRRIVDIFRMEDVTNVEFMWSPIIFHGAGDVNLYYPGNEYVDHIGLTAINLGETFGKNGEDYNWLNCDYLIEHQYNQVAKWNKEIIVTELLSNDVGGSKASWYKTCFEIIKRLDLIIGVISIQTDADYAWSNNPIDWRVNSSPDSLAAFKESIRNGL